MLGNLVSNFNVIVPLITPDMDSVEPGSDEFKELVIRKLVSAAGNMDEVRFQDILSALMLRERKGSTGLGRGIAIPHARTESIEKPVIVLGICPDGLDWNAQDGEPVHLVFLILVPLEQSDLYLRILTRLSSLVRMDGFLQAVLECSSRPDVLDVIHSFELDLKLRRARASSGGGSCGRCRAAKDIHFKYF